MKKIVLSLLITSFIFICLPINVGQANAATNLESYPTYSLYTKDNIIQYLFTGIYGRTDLCDAECA